MGQSFLEIINMFSYANLWRIGGKSELSHKFGGFMTLVLILIIIALTTVQILKVFRRDTIKWTTQNLMNFVAPMTKVTTSSTDPANQQFMFAVYLNGITSAQASDLSVMGAQVDQNYDTNTHTFTQNYASVFALEPCTPKHFSIIPNIQTNFINYGMDYNWLCLPINQTYQIGGQFSGNAKYIGVLIQCASGTTCPQATNSQFTIYGYTMSSFINAANSSTPFQGYLTQTAANFAPNSQNQNYLFLDTNLLVTDKSLIPISQISSHNAFVLNKIDKNTLYSANPLTNFQIFMSGTAVTINRSYFGFLDAISYVGGLVGPLLSLMFFMNAFGKFVYEMKIASFHFGKKILSQVTFLSFINVAFFRILTSLNRQPNWKLTKQRFQIQKTVNHLLDILYLQKRLQFLERAMTLLFEKHQLKGLHLISGFSSEEAECNYKNHHFKNNVLHFLSEQQNRQIQKNKNEIIKKNASFQKENEQVKKSNMPKINRPAPRQNRKGNINKIQERREVRAVQQKNDVDNIGSTVALIKDEVQPNINTRKQYQKTKTQIVKQEETQYDELELDMTKQQAFKDSLEQIKRLCREASKEKDMLSKKIFQRIDEDLRIKLMETLQPDDRL